jgi:hypothetical protein
VLFAVSCVFAVSPVLGQEYTPSNPHEIPVRAGNASAAQQRQRVFIAIGEVPPFYLGKNEETLYWFPGGGEVLPPVFSKPAVGILPIGFFQDGKFNLSHMEKSVVLAKKNSCLRELNKSRFKQCTFALADSLFPQMAPVKKTTWYFDGILLDVVGFGFPSGCASRGQMREPGSGLGCASRGQV